MSIQNDNNISKSFKDDFEILPENHENYDVTFKIIVIGNKSNYYISYKIFLILIIIIEVGKSCLSILATRNNFEHNYIATVGFEFFIFNIRLNNNINIKLQIWDLTGDEAYKSLIKNFYRNSSLSIIVYAIDE